MSFKPPKENPDPPVPFVLPENTKPNSAADELAELRRIGWQAVELVSKGTPGSLWIKWLCEAKPAFADPNHEHRWIPTVFDRSHTEICTTCWKRR